jgi:crotonobetainyl-CoA:carnitine CoA-transferase CaiB-like acyl-CoA transferase
MTSPRPLDGIVVLEFGRRLACGATGSLLAQLGATVFFTETDGATPDASFEDKVSQRDLFAYGKQSLRCSGRAGDAALLQLTAAADVIITSSDADAVLLPVSLSISAIVCDITAFGAQTTERTAVPVSDFLLQAMSGIADTTGEGAGPPVSVGAPVVEFSTALYAAASIVAGLRVRRLSGAPQTIDMSLYDCAVNAMATFFPSHFGGGKPRRLGNRHSMAAPWNAYRASDGWVLMCSASEAHWRKICEVIGQPELGRDPRYATLGDRMARRDEVDAHVAGWMARHPVKDCIAVLSGANIACGEIVPVGALADEPNLRHRHSVHQVVGPDGRTLRVAGNLFAPGEAAYGSGAIPAIGSGQAGIPGKSAATPAPRAAELPLKGMRVVELGQYTTAPLAGRHLAALGAEVIKVEPLEGDSARQWAPHRDGMSYFFVISNAGKRAVGVDLRNEKGLDFFRKLLCSADVLVENMKPGSLARLGFSAQVLAELNPRLVYTSITGFGADATYQERPAFDTVVQAMCGLMDVTRANDIPLKAGISIADICGGQLGLLAILAGLEQRDRTGSTPRYDLSMQDVAAWLTQLSWNEQRPEAGRIAAEGDGFIAVDRGGATAPVKSVAQVAEAPLTAARQLIVMSSDAEPWPLLGSPLRLSATPPRVARAIGQPEPLSDALGRELNLDNCPTSALAKPELTS